MLSNAALPAFHSAYVLYAANANGRFRAGLFAQIHTRRSGSRPGSGLRRTALTTLKIAVLPPMPRARAIVASAVTPGLRASIRRPRRRSFHIWLYRSYVSHGTVVSVPASAAHASVDKGPSS